MRTTNPARCNSEIARRRRRSTGAKAFRHTNPVRRVVGHAEPYGCQRGGNRIFGRARVKLGIAIPASRVLRQWTSGIPLAPPEVGAALVERFGQLGRLVIAACCNAFLVLMPVQAAEPPDLKVEPAMAAAAGGSVDASLQTFPMEEFLDRLMAAESGGYQYKKNRRSTALGPFQFIESTFLFVVKRHFASEVTGLSERQVLALRTDMVFSRRAAAAYVKDLMSALKDSGLPVTPANVRLAFLVGPFAAVRMLRTRPDQPLRRVLSAEAIAANPYMSGATIRMLVRKAAIDVSATALRRPDLLNAEPADAAVNSGREPTGTLAAMSADSPADATLEREQAGAPVAPEGEATAATPTDVPLGVKCEIGLASCRKWIALQERKAQLLGRSAE